MARVTGTKAPDVDFDHESERHAKIWPEEFAQMREQCPVAWTNSHGGYWVATSYEAVIGMARQAKLFSSEKEFDPETGAVRGGITIPPTPIPRGLPVEADQPEWDSLRGYINRKFAPKAVEGYRADARRFATALINRVIEDGEMDLVNDFTGPVPAMVTMRLNRCTCESRIRKRHAGSTGGGNRCRRVAGISSDRDLPPPRRGAPDLPWPTPHHRTSYLRPHFAQDNGWG